MSEQLGKYMVTEEVYSTGKTKVFEITSAHRLRRLKAARSKMETLQEAIAS